MQDDEVGDGTTSVVVLASELLKVREGRRGEGGREGVGRERMREEGGGSEGVRGGGRERGREGEMREEGRDRGSGGRRGWGEGIREERGERMGGGKEEGMGSEGMGKGREGERKEETHEMACVNGLNRILYIEDKNFVVCILVLNGSIRKQPKKRSTTYCFLLCMKYCCGGGCGSPSGVGAVSISLAELVSSSPLPSSSCPVPGVVSGPQSSSQISLVTVNFVVLLACVLNCASFSASVFCRPILLSNSITTFSSTAAPSLGSLRSRRLQYTLKWV